MEEIVKCIKLKNDEVQRVKDKTADVKVKNGEATYTSKSEWKKTTEKVTETVEQEVAKPKKVKKQKQAEVTPL